LVTLREINNDNFRECLKLKLKPEQEDFVASNMFSLAEAKADGVSIPLAIFADEKMVGFTMYAYDEKNRKGYIDRLMVVLRFQRREFGRAAMVEVIARLKANPGCKEIQTSFLHANTAADMLYASLGFVRNGQTTPDGDETVVILLVE
jgi:diamine N-acetyltransferase